MNGIVIVDKPVGPPSNQVLGRLKRLLGVPKMGFLGTLDPLASGVLPVFVGKATKLIAAFEGLEKEYRLALLLGVRTDTFDAEGQVVEERDTSHLSAEEVRAAVLAFRGGYRQKVPPFSAVKVGGVPAYRLARRGQPVPPRERTVELRELEIEELALPRLTLRVVGSAGTYMRSLAEDIGQRTGVGAHLTELRRTRCGDLFTLGNSVTLQQVKERLQQGNQGFLLNPAEFLRDHHPVVFAESSESRIRDGQSVPLGTTEEIPGLNANIKALRPCGSLIAIGKTVLLPGEGTGFRATKVLI